MKIESWIFSRHRNRMLLFVFCQKVQYQDWEHNAANNLHFSAYGGRLNKQISLILINKIMIYSETMTKMCDNSHLPPMDEILLSLRENYWTYM